MNPPIEINIQVYIRQAGYGGQIQLQENMELYTTDFAGMAEILAQFHQLALAIKAKHPPKDKL